MTAIAPEAVLLLVVWGTLVALDLVSVPQAMISRPLVAGTVAGWLAGARRFTETGGALLWAGFLLFAVNVIATVRPWARRG